MKIKIFFTLSFILALLAFGPEDERTPPNTGIQGGLVVCVEPSDSAELLKLRPNKRYVVQGLIASREKLSVIQTALLDAGKLGPVHVRQWNGKTLPFIDNLVQLLVAPEKCALPKSEILRVLSPRGVAIIGSRKIIKPWPNEIDEWTHVLHGPDNNAVGNDTRVSPPRSLQWIAAPRWARSHDHLATVTGAVSASGRIFSIVDEGPADSVGVPANWHLVARDAFSGILLWKQKIPSWENHLRPFRSGPVELPRRLVASGERLYVTLGYGKPVSALDAATGKVLHVYKGTNNTHEIVIHNNRLYLVVSDLPLKNSGTSGTLVKKLPPWRRDIYQQYVIEYPDRRIVVLDADTGKPLWTKKDDETRHLMPGALALEGDRLFFQNDRQVIALQADSGKALWRADRPISLRRPTFSSPTLVAKEGVVLSADRSPKAVLKELKGDKKKGNRPQWLVSPTMVSTKGELIAFSAETGKKLWDAPCMEAFNSPVDLFVAHGKVWTSWTRSKNHPGVSEIYDLKTGRVLEKRKPDKEHITVGFVHGRCHRNRATLNYVINGRAGVEFVDMHSDRVIADHWVRGGCQLGFLPCNGLLYAPPHSCACYNEAKLNGYVALSGNRPSLAEKPGAPRLLKGPAYGTLKSSPLSRKDWSTYRGNGERNANATWSLSAKLKPLWEATPGGKLTPPIAGKGKVYVVRREGGVVFALDARSGKIEWRFAAGGGIDAPPTLHGNGLFFGCRDGWVYGLHADDGRLAWRFRAAPNERQMVAFNRLESLWPVTGSPLLHNGSLYAVAGRSSYLDGGILLHRIDPLTGKSKAMHTIDYRERETGREPQKTIAGKRGTHMPGALPDVLAAKGDSLYLRHLRFDADLRPLSPGPDHLFSPTGFLDDIWWHRTYWFIGTEMLPDYHGWPVMGCTRITGRILATDGETVYGFGRKKYEKAGSHLGVNSAYRLFAADIKLGPPVPAKKDPGDWWKSYPGSRVKYRWEKEIPFFARAILSTKDSLFLAGPEKVTDFHLAAPEGKVFLRAVGTKDGKTLGEWSLSSPPVHDGLAAADGCLFLITRDGRVVCFTPQ